MSSSALPRRRQPDSHPIGRRDQTAIVVCAVAPDALRDAGTTLDQWVPNRERRVSRYYISRLILIVPTLFLLSIWAFLIIRLLPGDVAALMVDQNGYARDVDALRERLGINRPLPVQYAEWLGDAVRGDFGRSLWTGEPAGAEIMRRFPVSFELVLLSLAVAVVIGLPVGVLSAMKQDSWLDYLVRGGAFAFLALPSFWVATIAIALPAAWWGRTPPLEYQGFRDNPAGNLLLYLTPALIIGLHIAAVIVRVTRTTMLDVLRQDYVRTAFAKGLRGRSVIVRHALRNALIPVVTLIGVQIPIMLGSAIVFEQIFGLPGLGRLTLDSVSKRDFVLLQPIVLFFGFIVLIVNFLVDLSYGWLDPRVRAR